MWIVYGTPKKGIAKNKWTYPLNISIWRYAKTRRIPFPCREVLFLRSQTKVKINLFINFFLLFIPLFIYLFFTYSFFISSIYLTFYFFIYSFIIFIYSWSFLHLFIYSSFPITFIFIYFFFLFFLDINKLTENDYLLIFWRLIIPLIWSFFPSWNFLIQHIFSNIFLFVDLEKEEGLRWTKRRKCFKLSKDE